MTNQEIIRQVWELCKQFECTEEDAEAIYNEWESSIPFEGGMGVVEAIIHIKSLEIYE